MIIASLFLPTPHPAAPVLLALALLGHYLAYRYYSRRVVPAEVAQNDADITANGSQDNLRKGYHARRNWIRFWWLLGLTLAGSLPASKAGISLFALSFVGLGILLLAYFCRYFTPLLNLKRGLPEFHASGDSASWPDAAVWKVTRAKYANSMAAALQYPPQAYADARLRTVLTRVWTWGRLLYLLCLLAHLGLAGWAVAAGVK